ncbi:hypothetical protein V5E97_23125 [Singulisphaera sp. Ch08]|uniref:Uncharacterized protein n=1 Tax=Singulisphaera sp. Ch08 TaxID=3120278 RepID=A0AAU7C7U9_9BACT
MGISYDPSKTPDLEPGAMEEAVKMGLIPISVICTEEGSDEFNGVQFDAFVSVVPRIGERLLLEDGTACEVARVYHKVVKPLGSKIIGMYVTVCAYKLVRQ